MRKPFLLSVGFSMPVFGIYAHWYIPVRRRRRMRAFRCLGFQVIWTSYRRIKEVP